MALNVLLAIAAGFVVGRGLDVLLDKRRDDETGPEEVGDGVAEEVLSAAEETPDPDVSEAAGEEEPVAAVAAVAAVTESGAVAENGEEGDSVAEEAPSEGEAASVDVRQGILNVLSSSERPMRLSEIAHELETHFASLVAPMHELLKEELVIKEDKTYRLF